jgi:hypothetical protein
MHVHLNPFDPNLQLSMAKAAERAAAEQKAALVRKKLASFSSILNGDLGEDAIVAAGEREKHSEGRHRKQEAPNRQNIRQEKTRNSNSRDSGSFSTWA